MYFTRKIEGSRASRVVFSFELHAIFSVVCALEPVRNSGPVLLSSSLIVLMRDVVNLVYFILTHLSCVDWLVVVALIIVATVVEVEARALADHEAIALLAIVSPAVRIIPVFLIVAIIMIPSAIVVHIIEASIVSVGSSAGLSLEAQVCDITSKERLIPRDSVTNLFLFSLRVVSLMGMSGSGIVIIRPVMGVIFPHS